MIISSFQINMWLAPWKCLDIGAKLTTELFHTRYEKMCYNHTADNGWFPKFR